MSALVSVISMIDDILSQVFQGWSGKYRRYTYMPRPSSSSLILPGNTRTWGNLPDHLLLASISYSTKGWICFSRVISISTNSSNVNWDIKDRFRIQTLQPCRLLSKISRVKSIELTISSRSLFSFEESSFILLSSSSLSWIHPSDNYTHAVHWLYLAPFKHEGWKKFMKED